MSGCRGSPSGPGDVSAWGTCLGRPGLAGLRLVRSPPDERLLRSSSPSPSSSLHSSLARVLRPAWLRMHSYALSSQSSLRGPQCLIAFKGNTPACWRTPPPPRTVNGCVHFSVAALEAVAKVSEQNLILPRPAHGKTLLHGHRTREAHGVGGIAFSLLWGGDIQTPSCCQKFIATPPCLGAKVPSKHMACLGVGNQPISQIGVCCTLCPQCHHWAWGCHGFGDPTRAHGGAAGTGPFTPTPPPPPLPAGFWPGSAGSWAPKAP